MSFNYNESRISTDRRCFCVYIHLSSSYAMVDCYFLFSQINIYFCVWVKSNMHVFVIDSRPPRSTVNLSIFLFSNKFAYLYLRYFLHIVLVRDQFAFHNLTKIKISPYLSTTHTTYGIF